MTTYGRKYLETTEPTHDDYNYPSGSYTSPNGSMGKLHLTWTVPFEPGTLTAVARAGGRVVAQDEIRTAGPPHALTLTPDRRVIAADGTSLAFLALEVVDRAGVVVPGASNLIQFGLAGPAVLDGVDNGQQENPQSYRLSSVPAFNGRALVIIRSSGSPGGITVTAASAGLAGAKTTLSAVRTPGPAAGAAIGAVARGAVPAGPAVLLASAASAAASAAGGSGATADASYSGSPATVPAAMLDGDPGTGWSNYYDKAATANLLAVSVSNPADWVSCQLAVPAVLRLGPGLVHDQRHAGPARLHHGLILGRREIRAGAEPEDQPGHRLGPAHHAQLRPGPRRPGPAGHDERGARHRRGVPADRDPAGAQRQHRHHLSRRGGVQPGRAAARPGGPRCPGRRDHAGRPQEPVAGPAAGAGRGAGRTGWPHGPAARAGRTGAWRCAGCGVT